MEKALAQHPSPGQQSGPSSSSGSLVSGGSIPAALAAMEKGVSGGGTRGPSSSSSSLHLQHLAESSTPGVAGTKDITTGKLAYLLDQMKCVRGACIWMEGGGCWARCVGVPGPIRGLTDRSRKTTICV